MDKKILKRINMICPCCMEEHEVEVVEVCEQNSYKGIEVEYSAEHFYCDIADELYSDEMQLSANDISMKNAYRRKEGLLTSDEIVGIRAKYGISQSDFCCLLGWGGKTITRYEGHQVQDTAHDMILRKLTGDPEWFLFLLERAKNSLPMGAYQKYYEASASLFEEAQDDYLRKAILAKYVRYRENSVYNGNARISLDVVVDVIRYFSDAVTMRNLYKVKLMKLLWYSDTLSYKRRGHAITGLVYQAMPMGAVPIAHDSIIDLPGIVYEEVDMGEGTGYRFRKGTDREYRFLSREDKAILDEIVRIFGKSSKADIVETMHKEPAYLQTALRDIILFRYAEELSID